MAVPPITVMVKPVSSLCNMRCGYCFYADEAARRAAPCHPPMDFATLACVIRRVMIFADEQVTFVFQGGEPTLAGVDYFREVVRLERRYNSRQLRVHNVVQTNGLTLSEELIDLLVRHRFLLGISLDGSAVTHDACRVDAQHQGTYGRVMDTIRRLKAKGVSYNILCVLTNEAALRADEVLDALEEHRYLQFIPCLDGLDGAAGTYSLTEEAYSGFLDRAFERYERAFLAGSPISIRLFDNLLDMLCGRGPESCAMTGRCSLSMVVESDGTVYPCDFYALDEWALGKLTESPLRPMLRGARAEAFVQRSLATPEECRACSWYALCRNGCYRERDADTGRYRWCGVMKTFFQRYDKRLTALARLVAASYYTQGGAN